MLASRKKRVILTIIVLLLALLALFLSIGGRVLVISDDIAKDRPTDMVLLMGSLPDRTLGAYELASNMSDYHIYIVKSEMPGMELLQSRGVVMPNYADLAAQALLDLGIPQQNITVIDGAAASTRDEALILHQYLADKLTNRQLVVVTSKYHSRRAGWIFKSAFKDANRQIFVHATPYDTFDSKMWFTHREDIEHVIFEWIKMINFGLILCYLRVDEFVFF